MSHIEEPTQQTQDDAAELQQAIVDDNGHLTEGQDSDKELDELDSDEDELDSDEDDED